MIGETERLTLLNDSSLQEGTHVLKLRSLRECSSVGSEASKLREKALASWSHVSESAVSFCKYWKNHRLYLTGAMDRGLPLPVDTRTNSTPEATRSYQFEELFQPPKLLSLFPQFSETHHALLGMPSAMVWKTYPEENPGQSEGSLTSFGCPHFSTVSDHRSTLLGSQCLQRVVFQLCAAGRVDQFQFI